MAAGELHGRGAAALEGHIDPFHAGGVLDHRGQGLVGVLRLAAAHLEAHRLGLDRIDIALGIGIGGIALDPEQELVERQRCDRRQVRDLVAELGDVRQQVGIVGTEDDAVRIALGALAVDIAFGAGATALVHHHDRLLGELVLGDDRLDDAGEIIGAAAGARSDDELDRLGRLPGLRGTDAAKREHASERSRNGDGLHGFSPWGLILRGRSCRRLCRKL